MPDEKHSPLLGQRASRQTVCSSSSSSRAPVARYCRGAGALTLEPRRLAARRTLARRVRPSSETVHAAPDAGERGLADRLGERRVGVDRVGDVGEGQAGVDRQGELVHELGDVRPDQAGAEHAPAARLADDAHEARRRRRRRPPWSCR